MSRNANNVQGGGKPRVEQPTLAAGNYAARVVQVLFLGIQKQRAFQGQEKPPCDSVRITYELSTEFMKDADGNDELDRPRWMSETIPFHNLSQDRAKSTRRYRAIDPGNTCNGNFDKLIGMPCQVCVVLNPKGDKVYENIGDIAGAINLPGYHQPDLVNPPTYFDAQDKDNCSLEDFNKFPEFLQNIFKEALDYEGSVLCKLLGGDVEAVEEAEATTPITTEASTDNPY